MRTIVIRFTAVFMLLCGAFAAMAQQNPTPNIRGAVGWTNGYHGGYYLERIDHILEAPGINLDFRFSYNSSKTNKNEGYGPGWFMGYHMKAVPVGKDVDVTRMDGRLDRFAYNGIGLGRTGWVFFDRLMKLAAGKFLLITKEGMRFFFEDPCYRPCHSYR